METDPPWETCDPTPPRVVDDQAASPTHGDEPETATDVGDTQASSANVTRRHLSQSEYGLSFGVASAADRA
eukprot:9501030-Pyramimonas_sp.AAC.2